MKKRYSRKPRQLKEFAVEQASQLFEKAENVYSENRELANEYVGIARKLCMKYKAKMPSVLKRRYCKHCKCYLRVGDNCRIRLNKGKVVYLCLNCKHCTRMRYR